MMVVLKLPGVNKDGPMFKETQKPQIMFYKRKDYGLRKLQARLRKEKKIL